MTRARTWGLVIVCFVLTFTAGTAVGLLIRWPGKPPRRGSWMASKLGLSAEQKEQMHKIWSDYYKAAREQFRPRFRQLDQERDMAIDALLPETLKVLYDAVLEEHAHEMAALREKMQALRQEAREQTRQILTDQQWKQFEEMEKKRGRRGRRHRRGRPRPAATQKASPDGQG